MSSAAMANCSLTAHSGVSCMFTYERLPFAPAAFKADGASRTTSSELRAPNVLHRANCSVAAAISSDAVCLRLPEVDRMHDVNDAMSFRIFGYRFHVAPNPYRRKSPEVYPGWL